MLTRPKAAVIVCLFSEVFSDYGAVQVSCLNPEALGVVWSSRETEVFCGSAVGK